MAMKSELGKKLFEDLGDPIQTCLTAVDALNFAAAHAAVHTMNDRFEARQSDAGDDENSLNDLAILRYFSGFLSDYAGFWQEVVTKNYDASWNALQDTLDLLRVLKRLSLFNLTKFENQLVDLEKTYPYRMFASMGAIAKRVECSICGNDIDSFECTHRAGHLYKGKMAHGIVKEFCAIDHIALTENPLDKRCVMKVEGRSYEYPAIDWLAANLNDRRFKVSDFSHIEMSQCRKRNAQFVRRGRNEACFCGSKKKLKHCCIDKEYITFPHAEFILRGDPKVISPEDVGAVMASSTT